MDNRSVAAIVVRISDDHNDGIVEAILSDGDVEELGRFRLDSDFNDKYTLEKWRPATLPPAKVPPGSPPRKGDKK